MKLLVKPTGPFLLLDPTTGCVVYDARPSVVLSSVFIGSRTALGQLKILSNELDDSATDAEFVKYWAESEKDETLAVESFLSKFVFKDPEPKPEPKPEPIVEAEPEKAPAPAKPNKGKGK